MKRTLLLAVVVVMLAASPVMAKEGFYIGAFVPANSLSGDAGKDVSSGNGWGLRAGMGFNKYIAIEGNYSSTSHDVTGGDSGKLNGLAADLKLNFPLTSLDSAHVMTVEPYVVLGYAHHEIKFDKTYKSDGAQWGFGIELYLFKELSVQAGWTRTSVSFDSSPKRDGDITTIDFGLIYHFI